MMRTPRAFSRALPPVLLALALGTAADAAGPGTALSNDVSCCLNNTALAQKLHPPVTGDELFFSSQSNDPPGVMVLIDNSTSMLELQLPLASYPNTSFVSLNTTPAGTLAPTPRATSLNLAVAQVYGPDLASCHSNPYLEAVRDSSNLAYNNLTPYPVYDSSFSTHFDNTKYYVYMDWNAASANGQTAANACNAAGVIAGNNGSGTTATGALATLTERQRCQMCVAEAGYYIKPANPPGCSGATCTAASATSGNDGRVVFAGRYLNFFPPKFVVARKILTNFVNAQSSTRVAVSSFDTSNTNCLNASNSGGSSACGNDGAVLVTPGFTPDCGQTTWPADRSAVLNAINNISFGSVSSPIATPLAEALFNVGQWMTGDSTNDFYRKLSSPAANTWAKGSFTPPNSGSAANYPKRAFCTACQENSIVLITDGNPFGDNNLPKTKIRTLAGGTVTCPGTGCDVDDYNGTENLLADVAKMLSSNDLNPTLAGTQVLHTYTIGLGVDVPLLAATATAGKGAYYRANNATQLSDAIDAIVTDVQSRATAFSSTAIQTVQVGSGASAYVPRFKPDNTAIWEGHLYRFDIFNEFTSNVDKNGDGNKTGVYLVDADSDVILENDTGQFVKQGTGAAARPIWDAGARLQSRTTTTRNIYTALPTVDGTGKITAWTRTPFTSDDATATTLLPYLGIQGTNACALITTRITVNPPVTQLDCAKKIIDYIRGIDIFAAAAPLPNRPAVLGDIFHSAPVVVDPPADQDFCIQGLSSQCVQTAFGYEHPIGSAAATPATNYTTAGVTVQAYEKYFQDNKSRRKVVLVGANDGMLHAFDAGLPTTTPPTLDPASPFRTYLYSAGTGDELWAFITPDQLPRLQGMVTSATVHQLSMDGEIMVRDIWVDGSGASNTANQKESDEFHTIAIANEREGGTHSVALDLTDPTSPQMKWMWPPPCSADEQQWGQTWGQFTPKPPPIGPVLLQKTGGISRYTLATEERWIVMLNGGHDPYNGRGRAVAMLDAWTGAPLFKASYTPGASTPAAEMRYGFPATFSLVDFSSSGATKDRDGFFDTGIVGDEGGQMWTFRFNTPGHVDSTSGLVDNWSFGRAYEPTNSSTRLATDRLPIFTIAASTIDDQDVLHAYVGSGDRAYMKSTAGGDCRPDDLASCVEAGCTVSATTTLVDGASTYTSTFSGSAGSFTTPTQAVTTTSPASYACTTGSARINMTVSSCTSPTTGPSEDVTQTCAGAAYTCSQTGTFPSTVPVSSRAANTTTGSGKSGFINYVVFNNATLGTPARTRSLDAPSGASTYDGNRLQKSELVDVTSLVATSGTVTGGTPANTQSAGWTFTYANVDEKTGTSPSILGTCLIWSSLLPTAGTGGCASAGSLSTNNYQADFITGAPTCADSFTNVATGGTGPGWVRSISRAAIAPPAERTPSVEIGPGARSLRLSMTGVSPNPSTSGGAPSSHDAVTSTPDLMQVQFSIPLSAEQHACRHVDSSTCP